MDSRSTFDPTARGFSFGGQQFAIVDRTALYWRAQSALIVADLHLEKASWFAKSGQMLPPYDSLATLERLAAIIAATRAHTIWCLGDNFHDDAGTERRDGAARALLRQLTGACDWRWITGNHDAALSGAIGGTIIEEAEIDGVILRHRATPGETRAELSGHYHPKFRAGGRGRSISRACFVASECKLILPAFGALTGGLSASHPEIMRAAGAGAHALLAAADRVVRFAL